MLCSKVILYKLKFIYYFLPAKNASHEELSGEPLYLDIGRAPSGKFLMAISSIMLTNSVHDDVFLVQ